MEHFESWKDLINPEFYIKLGGYWLVLFIIFAETGLFIGYLVIAFYSFQGFMQCQ